jgi:signal transduction histidine kinase
LLARAADWLPDIDPQLGQFAAGDLRATVHERSLEQVIRKAGDAPTITGRTSGKHNDLGTVGRDEAVTTAADDMLGAQSGMVISGGRQDLHEREQLIREISHSINTPLAQIELTLRGVAETTGDTQIIGALRRSEQSVQLCRAVLAAYRDITAVAAIATQWDIQDLRQALRSVVEVYKARGLELPEEVSVEIDVPGAIPGYSNYMIISLLLPLLQNAVEAAPSSSQIRCWGIRDDNHYLLCVSNATRFRVDLGKLKLSNYTSKLGAHEGLGLSSVRTLLARQAHLGASLEFEIADDIFIATVRLPQEGRGA